GRGRRARRVPRRADGRLETRRDVSEKRRRGHVLRGLGLAPGVASGPVFYLENVVADVPRRKLHAAEVEPELQRLREALRLAEHEFRQQKRAVAGTLSETERRIFDAHLALYQDDLLRESVEKRIREQRINAESALRDELEHLRKLFEGMDS